MPTNPKIAIIGASYLQLPLVLKADEMGYDTYCFAYLEGAVCKEYCTQFYEISTLDKEAILAVCRELEIDAVLTISSDLAVPTVNYIGQKLGLVCNPLESTDLTTNKYVMKETLRANNLRSARFIRCTESEDLSGVNDLNYPLIVKPVDRSGSIGVTQIKSKEELVSAFEKARNASIIKEVIVEEFITGIEVSVETISENGQHTVLAITDKVTSGPPHFVELEHHQPSQLTQSTQESIKDIVISTLEALNIKVGASHTELIISADGTIYINETGARMGGDFIGSDLVQLSSGFDYLEGVLLLSLGLPITIDFKLKKHSGVIFKSEMNAGYFDKITGQEEFIVRIDKSLKDITLLEKSSDRGDYFIYQNEKRINLVEL